MIIMKTQEKNFDGIKLSGFTAILIMLALTGTAIYLLSLPQTHAATVVHPTGEGIPQSYRGIRRMIYV